MEKEILYLKDNTPLFVEVIERKGEMLIFRSEITNNLVLFYDGQRGSKRIALKLPKEKINEIGNALALIKRHYIGEYKKNAIEDFYPRIKVIVNRLYKGDYQLFNQLKDKDNSGMITANAELFRRAVSEVKAKGRTLKTDKLNTEGAEEILAILS